MEISFAEAMPDGRFKVVSVFAAAAVTLPDFAALVTLFAAMVFAAVFDAGLGAGCTAVFAAALAGLAVVRLAAASLLEVGLGALLIDLALLTVDWLADLLTVFVFVGTAVAAPAILLPLLETVPFATDLVTVAFIVSSFSMNCPVS